jgi:hypothetical protein
VYSNKISEAYPANNMIPTHSHFSVLVLQNVKSINAKWHVETYIIDVA